MTESWFRAIEASGRERESLLSHIEGLTIKALYTDDDRLSESVEWVAQRGCERQNRWEACQELDHQEPEILREWIKEDERAGVSSFLFRARAEHTMEIVDSLFEGLGRVRILLEGGGIFFPAAGLMNALWEEKGIPESDRRGAFRADPFGSWSKGTLIGSLDEALEELTVLVKHTRARLPRVSAIGVDSGGYSGAGAWASFDLGCSMATGLAYLKVLDRAGVSIDEGCRQMVFTYSVDCDIFLSIAKLRAARLLWSRVIEACGGGERGMRMIAKSASEMMTRRSVWLNLLRTTIAGFAAATAGADVIVLSAYDRARGTSGSFSRRLARNIHFLLREESGLDQVGDPGRGAWYIESLTDQLARRAWEDFQWIERKGGMRSALEDGAIAESIERMAESRRSEGITGVTLFPDFEDEEGREPRVEDLSFEGRKAVLKDGMDRVDAVMEGCRAGYALGEIGLGLGYPKTPRREFLPQRRRAQTFESAQDESQAYKKIAGHRPYVSLISLGSDRGWVRFVRQFFAAGGIEVIEDESRVPLVAVLCDDGGTLRDAVAVKVRQLRGQGAVYFYLTGDPGDDRPFYEEAGIDGFLFQGCDWEQGLKQTLFHFRIADDRLS